MALIEWSTQYQVGVAEFDLQHQKLVSLINELHAAMKSGKSVEKMGGLLGELTAYAVDHFAAEEAQFAKLKYPGSVSHIREHQAFAAKVGAFQKEWRDGRQTLSIEVMKFLRDWLLNHIQKVDQLYGPFFNGRGLS